MSTAQKSTVDKKALRYPNKSRPAGAVTVDWIAKEAGVSVQAAAMWVKEKGCPTDSEESVKAWIQWFRDEAPKTLNDAKLKKLMLDCQHRKNAIELQDLQLAEARKELLPVARIREDAIAIGNLFSAELLALAQDISGEGEGKGQVELFGLLMARIDLLMGNLRGRLAKAGLREEGSK